MANNTQDNARFRILVINPGSTSTKVAVYENEEEIMVETIRHLRSELDAQGGVSSQRKLRTQCVMQALKDHGIAMESLHAVAGRGGLVNPIDSGTYEINDHMLADLLSATAEVHASALGGIMAHQLAQDAGIPAYVVDPIVVDELEQVAKLTGFPGIERRSIFHALNQKAVARRCADDMGTHYEDGRYIVAHMGGGITIGAHRYGRVIDVNDALAGEGPFSPERCGQVPALGIIELCFSGAYTKQEMIDMMTKTGGMYAYLGTNDLRKCEKLIKEGDEYAALVLESMAYQVSKEIGAMVAALEGRVDAIILTGGLAYSTRFTGCIKQRTSLIAPVKIYPGEDEMLALAQGALRVLQGRERALEY
ncbi:butyrate kinase [Ruminococcaceae bacterium OttesenSCG-928-L11]|nr:butyrate kinase [Ruminococcaceae bacterium OttesenSCG-928-L11]